MSGVGFRDSGFRGLGFRGLGFSGLGFRVSGFRVWFNAQMGVADPYMLRSDDEDG